MKKVSLIIIAVLSVLAIAEEAKADEVFAVWERDACADQMLTNAKEKVFYDTVLMDYRTYLAFVSIERNYRTFEDQAIQMEDQLGVIIFKGLADAFSVERDTISDAEKNNIAMFQLMYQGLPGSTIEKKRSPLYKYYCRNAEGLNVPCEKVFNQKISQRNFLKRLNQDISSNNNRDVLIHISVYSLFVYIWEGGADDSISNSFVTIPSFNLFSFHTVFFSFNQNTNYLKLSFQNNIQISVYRSLIS